jgi:hypothetical protein
MIDIKPEQFDKPVELQVQMLLKTIFDIKDEIEQLKRRITALENLTDKYICYCRD